MFVNYVCWDVWINWGDDLIWKNTPKQNATIPDEEMGEGTNHSDHTKKTFRFFEA